MRLHEERDLLRMQMSKARGAIQGYLEFLEIDKFQSPEDWIRTGEVKDMLRHIREIIASEN